MRALSINHAKNYEVSLGRLILSAFDENELVLLNIDLLQSNKLGTNDAPSLECSILINSVWGLVALHVLAVDNEE